MTAKEEHMKHALELACKGIGSVNPNPAVGCVIVKDNEVIGKGWHKAYGKEHAEINALNNVKKKYGSLAKKKLLGSELYVTLEPCSKKGKTPPCFKSIVAAGIKKVYIAQEDPTQDGIENLTNAGLQIHLGLLQKKAQNLNLGFLSRVTKGRPHISCKIAMSLDGGIALSNGESKWITSKESRIEVQNLRAKSDAILTGIGTLIADNPQLTVRYNTKERPPKKLQPTRCLVDSNLRFSDNATLINDKYKTLIFCNKITRTDVLNPTLELIEIPNKLGKVSLTDLALYLGKKEKNYLMVESGPTLIEGFIKEKLVDELIFFIAPKLLGRRKLNFSKLSSTMGTIGVEIQNTEEIGEDLKVKAVLKYS